MVILWILFIGSCLILFMALRPQPQPTAAESFVDMTDILQSVSNQAVDAAPSTTELKMHYRALLLFADADIRAQGTKALRILANFRDRVYGPRDFRPDLKVEDILANWPTWMTPLDSTVKETPPAAMDAVTAERRMLAYLQKNFPEEPNLQSAPSIVRSLIEDFGRRFVFVSGPVTLRTDFAPQRLLKDWVNPIQGPAP
jgi:hypothetical protein